jgi:hypothetical protein
MKKWKLVAVQHSGFRLFEIRQLENRFRVLLSFGIRGLSHRRGLLLPRQTGSSDA